MCLVGDVGPGRANDPADVRCVQILANANAAVCGLGTPLSVDGQFGRLSEAALRTASAAFDLPWGGTVGPGAPLLVRLRAGLGGIDDRATFWGTIPGASATLVDLYHAPLRATLAACGIDTPLRIAHFLAQVGHECGDLHWQEELADGTAYEGRRDLGNTQPGDGPRFKGRGLIQLTGRESYDRYGRVRGEDFVTGDNPRRIAADPMLAADVAGWFWQTRGLNALADGDDVDAVTRRINGGTNGAPDRRSRLVRAKWFLRAT